MLALSLLQPRGARADYSVDFKIQDYQEDDDRIRVQSQYLLGKATIGDDFVLKAEGLVDFWASWCAPCKASFPALDEIETTYRDQGLVVLGVNVDTDKKAFEKFMKRMKPGFSIVRDASQKVVADAGVETMPSSFLVGRDGVIRSVHSGYHGNKTREQYIEEIEWLLAEPDGGEG